VPILEARKFIDKKEAWIWRFSGRGKWEPAQSSDVFPGARLLIRASAGGYSSSMGWNPESKVPVDIVRVELPAEAEMEEPDEEEAGDSDTLSVRKDGYQTLAEHTAKVVRQMQRINQALDPLGLNGYGETLVRAAQKHDWGKAHSVFQTTMQGGQEELWAKSPHKRRHERRFFRHELASALAMLQTGESDLATYLVAAHHGKVRANIRSLPGEKPTGAGRIARGIYEGDGLPEFTMSGEIFPALRLSLGPSDLGVDEETATPSWTLRVDKLLAEAGPFRLAFLEMLLRSADEAASAEKGAE
jgi:CRISPR-associated endonuclease/helicase Cas3